MNVMALAHKATRDCIAAAPVKLCYRTMFRAALIDLHRKYKAMTESNAQITSLEKYIASCQVNFTNSQARYEECKGDEFFLTSADNGMLFTENDDKTRLTVGNWMDAIRLTKRLADGYSRKYNSGKIVIVSTSAYFFKQVKYWEEQIIIMSEALKEVRKELE